MSFDRMPFIVGNMNLQMESESNEKQIKQERSRTRWTTSQDKIFAELVVGQIQLDNRPDRVFDRKTWSIIRDEFNRRTGVNFNNNQLRKHLDVLRARYYSIKSTLNQNNFVMEDPTSISFDLWEDIGAQPKQELIKIKDCPIYDQLCLIFADSGVDGKYAQSSHYEPLAMLENGTEDPKNNKPGSVNSVQNTIDTILARKRKWSSENSSTLEQTKKDQETNDVMAKTLKDMIAASKSNFVASFKQDRYTITECIRSLDGMEERVEGHLYYAALDLFDEPSLREMFLSLKSDQMRLAWLQGKCYHTTTTARLWK
ncbi:L10-interacting MYB domain-containing protein-like isoform X2 [Impatiens glandulifera]|uniref:L10-interacting MYB domain-containing protein-like isoform X2 n=1 Tax=Impatiens glandulifera TaxID=253017 RepID=UPI001FB105DD|nr:L10-interacting MYB domain-containing protein-like isoform X2 [Impatiens glandulifera]